MIKTIGNPLSWTAWVFRRGSKGVGDVTRELGGDQTGAIEIRRIEMVDLIVALRKGWQDFLAMRTDVMFIVLIYPLIGVLLTWIALNRELLPMLFPLVAGFALLGPASAIGLYELSRRREAGLKTGWGDAFGVVASPSFAAILVLSLYLLAIFGVWLFLADLIYNLTLGPEPPVSAGAFLSDIFTTAAGWAMLVIGLAVGFALAALVLAISLVSFPLLLDRHVGIPRAVVTSVRISRQNPLEVLVWGAIVVVSLVLGALTLFIGMVIVLPVLGHATWHLYRQTVVRPGDL